MTTGNGVDCGGGVVLERRVPCRMPDGVTLYADHYRPVGDAKRPTLLMRQPYGRDIASTVVYAHPVWFARHGYNVVIQDVRGRGDSEGEFYPFRNEAKDGAATIAAMRCRPEADGKVGMYGFSYQGATQFLAAAERPAGLLCIAPAMAATDLYGGWFYQNGALRLASTMGWGLQMLRADARRRGLSESSRRLEDAWVNLPAQYLHTPYFNHPAITGEELPTYVTDWMEQDQPDAFWSSMDVSETVGRIDIPALHISGWYDTYLRGTIAGYLALRSHAGSAYARDNQHLLAGPWIHIPWGDRIGASELGPDAAFDTDTLLLRWFNHWLMGSGEFTGEPRVRHFALNQGRWRSAAEWPASENALTLYLHSNGRANSRKGDGQLSVDAPLSSGVPDHFVYDPEVPVLAPGGIAAAPGPEDQTNLELSNNVLVYTTAPLQQQIHVFGSPELAVVCASSAPSVDLVAKLVCVRHGGKASFVCLGIARSQHMFPDDYSADKARCWRLTLDPTSWVFAAGDRLLLEISSSAYPLFDRNSCTGVPARLAHPGNWGRSTQTIFHDQLRPSTLHLPIAQDSETSG